MRKTSMTKMKKAFKAYMMAQASGSFDLDRPEIKQVNDVLNTKNVVSVDMIADDCKLLKATEMQCSIVRDLSAETEKLNITVQRIQGERDSIMLPKRSDEDIKRHGGSLTQKEEAAAKEEASRPLLNQMRGLLSQQGSNAIRLAAQARLNTQRDLKKLDQQMHKIQQKILECAAKSQTLTKKLGGANALQEPDPVCAFVTFNRPEIADLLVQMYGNGGDLAYCCQAPSLYFNNRKLRVKYAPPLPAIIWQNLSVEHMERGFRICLSNIASATVIILCAFGLFLLSSSANARVKAPPGCGPFLSKSEFVEPDGNFWLNYSYNEQTREYVTFSKGTKRIIEQEEILRQISIDRSSPRPSPQSSGSARPYASPMPVLADPNGPFGNLVPCFCYYQLPWSDMTVKEIRAAPMFEFCTNQACKALLGANVLAALSEKRCAAFVSTVKTDLTVHFSISALVRAACS